MEIDNKVVEEIIKLLREIGDAVANEGFALAVRYVVINAWTQLISTAFVVVAYLIALVSYLRWRGKRPTHDDGYRIDYGSQDVPIIISLGAAGIVVVIGLFGTITIPIQALLIPEWFAIQELIGLIK